MLLEQLLVQYLDAPQKRLQIRSEQTRTHYRRSVRLFADHLGRIPTSDDLTDDNLCSFVSWTLDSGLSEATANQRVKQLRAMWEWAARRRIVDAFPTFTRIREPERMPSAWTPADLAKLFTACGKAAGWIGPHDARDWWLGFHYWLLDTGERADASLNLSASHIDLVGRTARVPAEIRKGRMKAMVYRLTPRTCRYLHRLIERSGGGVFTEPWKHRASFYNRYKHLIDDAGLPYRKHKSGPQRMRITVLTMVEAYGGDATAFARHSSRRVTDESYIDRTLMKAHDKGDWPRENFDPLDPESGKQKPWWLRLVS